MNLLTLHTFESHFGRPPSEEEENTSVQWLRGQTVLLRVDFNVPLDTKRQITDDTRITATLPTIQWLRERGAKIVLLSHLGRPKGTKNPAMSLMPVAERLQTLLDTTIYFCDIMDEPETLTRSLNPGDIVLLENLRFHPEEKFNDERLAQKFAMIGDFYVNDAFGLIHREHASVHALASIFAQENKAFAGFLIEKECEALDAILHRKGRSTSLAVLGGSKVSDKIILIESFARRCKNILIGGAMGYTFMKAKGLSVGKSRVEKDKLSIAREVLEICAKRNTTLHLPIDHICATDFSEDAEFVTIDSPEIPADMMGLDIGPKTKAMYAELVENAGCIFWNGPMGVFEWSSTAEGTRAIAMAMNKATQKEAYTVVGGGDSAAAVEQMELAEAISHISTGGGASLKYLEQNETDPVKGLPGLQFLVPQP